MDVRKITIDGPAGAGKSTVAKILARKLGFLHLDSGAVYRAIGYGAKEAGVDVDDESAVSEFAKTVNVDIDNGRVFLNGKDITEKIRTPEGGVLASKVARFPEVREKVIEILREIAKDKKVITDGRDAGTNIFPDADVKIFLTASCEERAKRRYEELKKKGFNISYDEILKEITSRDNQDKNRKVAPLTVPEGAVVIDTTGKSVDEVVAEIEKVVSQKK
ncbi:(d)CMP kinase [Desulfurobacterium atlanticum]|uniref:Cytidylate kinase n=1 Tax=Desulfurobacterium atlanticum TaxID=240169 RepID=A0A238Z6C3_9BACT|nr:(d)CMP kinase [Desulfurobacterium atlanticum]SNR78334.1 cytidylate kinase [Desulfurobacterium atlanticum]